MASQGAEPPASSTTQQETTLGSSPVEMSDLPSSSADAAQIESQSQSLPEHDDTDTTAGAEAPTSTEPASSTPGPSQDRPSSSDHNKSTSTRLTRMQSEALGPATEGPIIPPTTTVTDPEASRGPTLIITLMLTTGARHPYKIDEKYLRNRKVEAVGPDGTFDPRELSGYKLKELIWTDWRSEWEPRPASPSSIRLIILGRLLEDKASLKDFPFKLDDTNILHMTVKPADFLDDDEGTNKGTGKGHSIRARDGEEGGAGCRCVIL